jgi:hypothetical protein
MTGFMRATSRCRLVTCGHTLLLLLGTASAASAQQVGTLPQTSRPISTEVAVEYATIGAVQLSVPILRPDSATVAPNGQVATNRQIGFGNTTDISQTGQGNRAAVDAVGNLNTARISQQGVNNTGQGTLSGNALRLDLQQVGNGNQADLSVNGPSGGSLAVGQFGNGNSANLSVPAGRDVNVNQVGNGLSADVSQIGAQKSISVLQMRAR